jgi:HK97 gp10 family phage protein
VPKGVGVDPRSSKEVKALLRDLKKFDPELAKEVRKRFKAAANPILNAARRRQPKDTGELRRRTKVRFARGRTEIRSSAPHARISEFGGRHPLWGRDQWVAHPAQPAIFPAVDAGRKDFIREAEIAVTAAARKAGFQ